jgi:hypothetical protein
MSPSLHSTTDQPPSGIETCSFAPPEFPCLSGPIRPNSGWKLKLFVCPDGIYVLRFRSVSAAFFCHPYDFQHTTTMYCMYVCSMKKPLAWVSAQKLWAQFGAAKEEGRGTLMTARIGLWNATARLLHCTSISVRNACYLGYPCSTQYFLLADKLINKNAIGGFGRILKGLRGWFTLRFAREKLLLIAWMLLYGVRQQQQPPMYGVVWAGLLYTKAWECCNDARNMQIACKSPHSPPKGESGWTSYVYQSIEGGWPSPPHVGG